MLTIQQTGTTNTYFYFNSTSTVGQTIETELKRKRKEMRLALNALYSLHEERNSIEMFPGAEKD